MADSTTYGLLIQCEEQLAEMADLKIPCATLQSLLNLLINQVPSLTADESVKRAREFLELLERRRTQYSNAAVAAPQTAAAPAAPAGAAPAQSQARCSEEFDPIFAGQDNHANNHDHTEPAAVLPAQLHRATIRKCERVRACAFEFVKAQLALRRSGRSLSVRRIADAVQQSGGIPSKETESLFRNNYLDHDDLINAARNNDITHCTIGRVLYPSIDAFLSGAYNGTQTARRVKAAADWCVGKMLEMKRAKIPVTVQTLDELWTAEGSDRPHKYSLRSYFKNGRFSIDKLEAYARRHPRDGEDAREDGSSPPPAAAGGHEGSDTDDGGASTGAGGEDAREEENEGNTVVSGTAAAAAAAVQAAQPPTLLASDTAAAVGGDEGSDKRDGGADEEAGRLLTGEAESMLLEDLDSRGSWTNVMQPTATAVDSDVAATATAATAAAAAAGASGGRGRGGAAPVAPTVTDAATATAVEFAAAAAAAAAGVGEAETPDSRAADPPVCDLPRFVEIILAVLKERLDKLNLLPTSPLPPLLRKLSILWPLGCPGRPAPPPRIQAWTLRGALLSRTVGLQSLPKSIGRLIVN